jgi:hypothetical protein
MQIQEKNSYLCTSVYFFLYHDAFVSKNQGKDLLFYKDNEAGPPN